MKRRVLFITRTLSRSPGGMQTHARSLIAALHSSDISLRVCGFGGPSFLLPCFVAWAFFRSLVARVDTVHVSDASMSILFPILALLRPNVRRTVTVHGLDVLWNFPGYRSLIGFCLRCAHCVAPVSMATAVVVAALGVHASSITVVPCGAPKPADVPNFPRTKQLLSVGRLIPRKGIAWFLQHVFASLASADLSLHYVIVGTGPELPSIQSLVASLHLESRVSLRTSVSDVERDALYDESAMLVVPNIPIPNDMEGFGIVCIEAASRGLPVVAACLDGLGDAVIEEATGVFFTPLDAKDAQDAVMWVLKNPFDPARIRTVFASKFEIGIIASRYVHEVF